MVAHDLERKGLFDSRQIGGGHNQQLWDLGAVNVDVRPHLASVDPAARKRELQTKKGGKQVFFAKTCLQSRKSSRPTCRQRTHRIQCVAGTGPPEKNRHTLKANIPTETRANLEGNHVGGQAGLL